MLRLRKFYKPFIGIILIVACLLGVQATCDLKLPDYMSEIVNVGIQTNGIEDVTPVVISEKGLMFISLFMNEDEKEFVLNNYIKINSGNTEYVNKYPLVETENIYILNNIDKETIIEMDSIFSVSCKTMVNILTTMRNLSSAGDGNRVSIAEEARDMDITKLYEMFPMILNLPEELLNEVKQEAENSDTNSLIMIGKIFTKAFYNEIGLDTEKLQTNYIVKIGLKMIAISILGGVCIVLVSFFTSRMAGSIARTIRKTIFEKVQSFSTGEFNKFGTASLITRTTNDITQIQQITAMGMRMLLFSPIMGVGSLIMMFQKSRSMVWTLGIGLGGVVCLVIALFIIVMPKFEIIQKLADKLNLVTKENLTGIMVIRAFGTQEHEGKRFNKVNKDITDLNIFVGRIMGFAMPCMMLIMNLLTVLIVWVGADKIASSTIQVGDMMASIQYAMHVLMSFIMLTMISIMIPRAGVSAKRIADVLETKTSINNPENPIEFKEDEKGYVEFKNVGFQFEGATEKVLDNISFIARPGETTAFIGSTGSGKSTLINLIPRFYDVTEGEILVSGINVKSADLFKLHKQIGYIPQKGNLLSGTIEFNLKYGNNEATDEFMKECSQIAQAEEFIEQKENKYNEEVAQGAKNVSGGQKQRLSIARALVKNAPIYIFDDSFSALDFKTDAKLREELKKHTNNSTILIVAQRVNTIMNAEQIIVLDQGKIVGKGTHGELLNSCPIYYEIASSQLTKEELENGRK